jgi:N-acetylglucosaminyldiphosphoundecaprenol N-acetyl-beta-D-mannosaminyltransferase
MIQRLGLEWLHRLVNEPRRLAKRYLVHDLPYAIWLLFNSALHRNEAPLPDSARNPAEAGR